MEIFWQYHGTVDLPSELTIQMGIATHSVREAVMRRLICVPLCFRHHEAHSKRNYSQTAKKQPTSIRTLQ